MKNIRKPGCLTAATLMACMAFATTAPAMAQSAAHTAQETKEDITRHRAMAATHENAAQCLEGGKKHELCAKELQTACKGLAIGKYCGMKHVH